MNVDEREFFREVTLQITSSLEIEQALARTFTYVEQFIPMEVMSLHYFDPQRQGIYAMATHSSRSSTVGYQETPVLRVEPDELARLRRAGAAVARDRPVQIFNRPQGDPLYRGMARFMEDLGLPVFSSLKLLLDIGEEYQGVLIIAAPGHGVFGDEHGALIQTVEEPLAIAMSNARRYREIVHLTEQLAADNLALRQEMVEYSGNQVIGAESGLRHTMELVKQVAPTRSPVLLTGDTGTGKEVVANAIHSASPRREGPMIRVQCGAYPDTLLDSELFGHEKGAFTGATEAKRGRFERADGGTIFFDEIGELTLDAQVKLLRVLEDQTFERLGGTQTITADVRVIAATNRDLHAAVRNREFREDLWFRLNVFPVHLPPLRQRQEDIPALVRWFIDRKTRELGLSAQPQLAPGATDQLMSYEWPGNVRELQNVIERAIILSRGQPLAFPELGSSRAAETPAVTGISSFPGLDRVVADHIRQAVGVAGGRIQGDGGAADLLGVNPSTLRARMRKLGIPFGRWR